MCHKISFTIKKCNIAKTPTKQQDVRPVCSPRLCFPDQRSPAELWGPNAGWKNRWWRSHIHRGVPIPSVPTILFHPQMRSCYNQRGIHCDSCTLHWWVRMQYLLSPPITHQMKRSCSQYISLFRCRKSRLDVPQHWRHCLTSCWNLPKPTIQFLDRRLRHKRFETDICPIVQFSYFTCRIAATRTSNWGWRYCLRYWMGRAYWRRRYF